MLLKIVESFARVTHRGVILLPFVFFGFVLLLRSQVDYREYLETYVGPNALAAAQTPAWVEDAPLWAMARQGFWHDILAVASEANSLMAVTGVAFLIGAMMTCFDHHGRPGLAQRGHLDGGSASGSASR